jgi:hypothetical protein
MERSLSLVCAMSAKIWLIRSISWATRSEFTLLRWRICLFQEKVPLLRTALCLPRSRVWLVPLDLTGRFVHYWRQRGRVESTTTGTDYRRIPAGLPVLL